MNKHHILRRFSATWLTICLVLLGGTASVFAQGGERRITGTVTDESGAPVVGAIIVVAGTSSVATSGVDGDFGLRLPAGSTEISISCVGYETQIVQAPESNLLNVQLRPDARSIDDVVVIGYGTQRKSDLTGSVSDIKSKDFNGGLINSPAQLINGKVSGVQIMSGSGSPSAGSTIRIRGGASLNASNDPLIVLDGVPLESGGISGNSGNFLSLINPADIESMTILKDASSTAIYGSRASNGVIIITTKKGTNDRPAISFNTTNSVQTGTRMAQMLSRNEFIDAIKANGTAQQIALLGDAATDWNDRIFRTAFGTDNNLSLAGRLTENWPMRVSAGYWKQDGLMRKDNSERFSGNLSLSPSLLDDHLKLSLNVKGSLNNNMFSNGDAIWAASTFNPTIPVFSGVDAFGGYNEAVDANGSPVNAAVRNPAGLVRQYTSTSNVWRVVGNFDIDYKMHFLPELKFHATFGYDQAQGKGDVFVPAEAAQYFSTSGRDYTYGPQKNSNRLLTTYLNYNKYFESIKSSVDVTAGYDYQYWKTSTAGYNELNTLGEVQTTSAAGDQRHVLLSYYARLNYTFDYRYMLTATVRRDGTSRFHRNNRWGTFPSVALAWHISREEFLGDNPVVSNLKLRVSYGVTGQQDGIGNYNYLPVYTYSQDGADVQFGDQWLHTYRPEAYVENLKWESTESWNAGLDFGFLKDRITGSVDFYTRQTKDLLATVPSPAGANFDKNILTNVGNVDSHGVEFNLNATPVSTPDFVWDVSFNMTWQKMKVRNLSLVEGTATTNTQVGPSIDSYRFQILSEGYTPYMFYVYHQLYDEATGKPVEGAYADLDGNGSIDSGDLYRYHSPAPDFLLGLSTSLRYKSWSLGMSFRANLGNYVYNGMGMNTGAWDTVSYNSFQLNNMSSSFLDTGFRTRQHLSDHYVENASFLKMDNISLNYNFGRINKWMGINVSAMVQNVFCITRYTGVDPEVPGGMDISFYPRPRTFSLGVGLEF